MKKNEIFEATVNKRKKHITIKITNLEDQKYNREINTLILPKLARRKSRTGHVEINDSDQMNDIATRKRASFTRYYDLSPLDFLPDTKKQESKSKASDVDYADYAYKIIGGKSTFYLPSFDIPKKNIKTNNAGNNTDRDIMYDFAKVQNATSQSLKNTFLNKIPTNNKHDTRLDEQTRYLAELADKSTRNLELKHNAKSGAELADAATSTHDRPSRTNKFIAGILGGKVNSYFRKLATDGVDKITKIAVDNLTQPVSNIEKLDKSSHTGKFKILNAQAREINQRY